MTARHAVNVGALVGLATVATCGQTLTGLGRAPGGNQTVAWAISGDGTVVVGQADTVDKPWVAFRWTAQTGMVLLNMPPDSIGGPGSVSRDGSVIAGSVQDLVGVSAAAWTAGAKGWAGGGMCRVLELLPGGIESGTGGVSADGLTIVGSCSFESSGRACQWTATQGVQSLRIPANVAYSGAAATSATGWVIVGTVYVNGRSEAFRWTQGGAMESLGVPTGGHFSEALCVSANATVIVGYADTAATPWQTQVFRWTRGGGMEILGTLPGHRDAFGFSVNADGSAIVGNSSVNNTVRAFLWTRALGMVDLNVYLPTQGISLAGWLLTNANGISDNGRAIVGTGYHHGQVEGWVVTLGSCYANCDQSTAVPVLNVADFVCFLSRFTAGDPYANCDGSIQPPMLNVADLLCFQQRFAAGCP